MEKIEIDYYEWLHSISRNNYKNKQKKINRISNLLK